MWTLFQHQLRDNLRSLRFQVSLVVLLLFFVCNGLVYSMKVERLTQEDRAIEADDARRYEQVRTVADAAQGTYRILDQERGTEFIAEAGFNWFQSSLWLSPELGYSITLGNVRTTNNWMRRFEVLDWSLAVRYVLSFLCVVLGYNAVSGELESGTLRLVLANPVARGSFLIGRFLAHLATLLAPALLGILLSLGILAWSGWVELSWALCRACLLFGLGAAFLSALFLLLSMGVSALARTSAASLLFLVTAWTVLIVVIPQASYLIATQRVPSVGRYWEEMERARNQTMEALAREGSMPRDPVLAAQDGYAAEQRFVQRMAALDAQLGQMARQVEQQRQDQYRMAMRVNLLSPGYAFQYSVEAVLGAGVQKTRHFADQAWRYRQHLQEFLRAQDAVDAASPHLCFLPRFTSTKPLDPALIPRFRASPVPLDVRLANAAVPAIVLVLETALTFFFALWALNRADLAAAG
ncbi:MAG: ABC transporter permease subunit [Candidatus Latescibacterota bacterium]